MDINENMSYDELLILLNQLKDESIISYYQISFASKILILFSTL